MISFNKIGSYGRLGNQMFQYAALKGIAAKHNYEFSIPPSNASNEWYDHMLLQGFELSSLKKENIKINQANNHVKENSFSFDENLFDHCLDDTDIEGYLQSERYFKHIADDVKKDFTFLKTDDTLIEQINNEDIISLHIRRGDYVAQPNHHPVCSLEYYEESLSMLPHTACIVFSDDINWCKTQEVFKNERFFFASENNTNLIDMYLMTRCSYHIIANSSFSWWGAWLADSKKIIAPRNWFGPALNHNTDDLIPPQWERI